MKTFTAEMFKEATGCNPIQDDLERVNCEFAGEIGHSGCGWCEPCNKPRWMCGHFAEFAKEKA